MLKRSDEYVYIFVRQDLPIPQQIVQSNHATYALASLYGHDGDCMPNIVLIGVPDREAILRVSEQCSENAIPHYTWNEPDWDYGITAISTAAIRGNKRLAFAEYQLWNTFAISSVGRAVDSNSAGPGFEPQMAIQV